MLKKEFTDEELIQFMRKNYHNTTTLELGVIIGLPASKVYKLAYKLGLRKSPEHIKAQLAAGAKSLAESGKAHRYKPGQGPANKGKKMPKEVYKKVQKTMFKPGHKPQNTKHDGHISVRVDSGGRQYAHVRVRQGEYKLLHRVEWEKHNGPIPKGYVVTFKNDNSLDCSLENLELITRKENCLRNSIHQYPPEICKAIRQLSKLKKTIKQHETN